MKQVFRERECIHKDEGVPGDFYNGGFYLQALQRLPIDQAMQVAARVGSFSGLTRQNIKVWLCTPCASELNLGIHHAPFRKARDVKPKNLRIVSSEHSVELRVVR